MFLQRFCAYIYDFEGILEKKIFFLKCRFFGHMGGYIEKNLVFQKKIFFPKFPQNHKCRHKTIIETYFFQKFYK